MSVFERELLGLVGCRSFIEEAALLAGDSRNVPRAVAADLTTQCILSQVESLVSPQVLGNNYNSWYTVLFASLCPRIQRNITK